MIKQPIFAAISLALFVGLIYCVIDRIAFLKRAQRADGIVTQITSYNSRCGGGRRSRSYACTKFTAHISYRTQTGLPIDFTVGAGSSRGSNLPHNYASMREGQSTLVIYDPKDPSNAYISMASVWFTPFALFVSQLISGFSSLVKPRNQNSQHTAGGS